MDRAAPGAQNPTGRQARAAHQPLTLACHLDGASYIAAWTAFLVNIRPMGDGLPMMLIYPILPGAIGST